MRSRSITAGRSCSEVGSARCRSSSTIASGCDGCDRIQRLDHQRHRSRAAHHARSQRLRRLAVGLQPVEQIGEQHPGAVPRERVDGRDAARHRQRVRLGEQTCLAHALRADDRDRAAATRFERLEMRAEHIHLALAADQARRVLAPRCQAVARAALERAHQLEHPDLFGFALEEQAAELAVLERVAGFVTGLLADVDRAERRSRLESGRHVDGVAQYMELADHAPPHVTRDDGTGVDPDQHVQRHREAANVLVQQLAHLERCPCGSAGRIGERHRVSEHRHQRVAEIVVDGTPVPACDAVQDPARTTHCEVGRFLSHDGREFGESNEIGEEHRRARALRARAGGAVLVRSIGGSHGATA